MAILNGLMLIILLISLFALGDYVGTKIMFFAYGIDKLKNFSENSQEALRFIAKKFVTDRVKRRLARESQKTSR